MGCRPSFAVAAIAAFALAGCDENGEFTLGTPQADTTEAAADTPQAGSVEIIEQDVEAPEIFEANEAGLWDGRPSLGGVWVAHPDVDQPERALIRNEASGKEVIGALFRRERENPGPRIQVSSDAADALGMLAGQPQQLNIVALKRETVEIVTPIEEDTVASADAADIDQTSLDDPLAAAEAAISEAESGGAAAAAAATGATAAAASTQNTPSPAPAPSSSLEKPYVQIGIFSVEANANNTAASLRNVGIVPTVLKQESQGKTFWRVIVGPATTKQEQSAILKQVKELGFSDAYYVTN